MSKLGPAAGELPTKIAFDGVEQGSPEARLLYAQYGGAIRHFHAKARQTRLISESPSQHMHAPLPGGGRMTYSWNDGQEVIRVNVKPTQPPPQPVGEQPPQPTRADPALAIDVLFTNTVFIGYDIYVLDRTVTIPGGTYPSNPETWDVQTRPGAQVWIDRYGDDRMFDINIERQQVYYNRQIGPIQYVEDIETNLLKDGPIEFFYTFEILTYKYNYAGMDPPTTTMIFTVEIGDRQPGTPGGTYPPVTNRYYARETRHLFDTVLPVGAVGNPEPKRDERPYEAVALGRTGRSEDGRLVPAAGLQVAKACSREFTVLPGAATGGGETGPIIGFPEVDAPPFWFGQGFVAQPHKPQVAGVPNEKTIIDLYIASANNTQKNDFGIPNPTPTRFDEVNRELTGEIAVRVREFADAAPVGVRVDITTQMLRTTYAGQANQRPQQLLTTQSVASNPPRPGTWHFAAGSNWSDGGNEPAEPERRDSEGKDMMGKLLAADIFDAERLSPISPISPVPGELLNEPRWPGEVEGKMLFLCRIEWTPPEAPYLKGKAEILGGGRGPLLPPGP